MAQPIQTMLYSDNNNYAYREWWSYPYNLVQTERVKDVYGYSHNIDIRGKTLVEDIQTKCKLYVFNKNFELVDVIVSDSMGDYKTNEVHENNGHYIVCVSLDTQCPDISGMITPTTHNQPVILTYAEAIAASSPITYWEFNESSGTLVDTQGLMDLDIVTNITYNTPSLTTSPTKAISLVYGSLATNSNDYRLPELIKDFSFEVWVNYTTLASSSYGALLAHRDNASTNRFFFGTLWGGNGTFGLYMKDVNGVSTAISSTNPLNDGNTHHVVISRTGDSISIYVDGILDNSKVIADINLALPTSIASGIKLGQYGSFSNNGFIGTIDELAVYDKGLTLSEVEEHYNIGKII